jgi:hypothetical protein
LATSESSNALGTLLIASVVAMTGLAAGGQFIASNDLHIFMAMGQEMAQSGQFMQTEAFTWTAQGTPFVHGPWGFSLLSWWIYDLTGLVGLRLFTGFLAGLTVALLGRAAILKGADTRAAAFSCLFAFVLLFQNLAVRAQTWAYPLLALLIWWIAKERTAKSSGWIGVAIGCVWANLHGSFPAALVLLGIMGLGRALDDKDIKKAWPLWGLAAAFALGTCIGPNGPGIYSFILSNSELPQARGLSEWNSPELLSISGLRLSAALVLWALLLLKKPKALSWADTGVVLAFAGLGLTGTRFISWFGLASSVPLALILSQGMRTSTGLPTGLFRRFRLGLALCWIGLLARGLGPRVQELRSETPAAAIQAIQASATSGRLLNPPEYGGYARFTLGPQWEISSDMRVWVFDDAAWAVYPELAQAPPNWSERLDKAGVTHLLLLPLPYHRALIDVAKASADWKLLAEDEFALAFQRQREAVPAAP